MNLSEVFYEAACRMSDTPRDEYGIGADPYEFSCQAVSRVSGRGFNYRRCAQSIEYADLMDAGEGLEPSDVGMAARSVGWRLQDYRIFMLLMASEAVK